MIAGAVLTAALVTLGGAGPVAAAVTPTDHTIIITDEGKQNLPEQWFADAVVLPGDSGERTVVLENARSVATTVTVGLTDGAVRGTGLYADLSLYWEGGSGALGDVLADQTVLIDRVSLEPGESIPVTLGYLFSEDATQVATDTAVTDFSVMITATDTHDTDGGNGGGGNGGDGNGGGGNGGGGNGGEGTDGNGGGSGSGHGTANGGNTGDLAATGGNISGPWLFGLLSLVAGWFLIAARRRRGEAQA